jgi:RNA ligase
MNYRFPIIRNINDVLPHVEGRDEFVVAEREGYTVVNYVVAMADTFDMYPAGYDGPLSTYDLGGAIRRECRGLIFYPDGRLMSRPFHKFFNVNEREETQTHAVDMSQQHVIMEKMDGSMIRPILVDGHLRLATKMGVTSVAMDAEAWLAAHSHTEHLKQWLRWCMGMDVTPIFEWVSPFNQIVLAYEEADLVLLAMRDNETGEYHMPDACPFNTVAQYGSVEGNLADYISRQRGSEGREGDIIRFADGHMLKVKNDWYVRIHKTVDRIVFDRNIVNLILNEEVDDVVPMLPRVQADRVRDFERRFAERLHNTVEKYDRYWNTVVASGLDRKRYAQEWMPTIKNNDPFAAVYVFGRFGDRDGRAMILDHIEKSITTNVRWDECAVWMGM